MYTELSNLLIEVKKDIEDNGIRSLTNADLLKLILAAFEREREVTEQMDNDFYEDIEY